MPALERIVLGSCLVQTRAHPALDVAIERDPDLVLFLGDNVYADSPRESVIRRSYETLGRSDLFSELRSGAPMLAIWDDHDYGANDSGREFGAKAESERIFEEFWDVHSAVRERPGIYQVAEFDSDGRTVQIILLDTRFFRTGLTRARPRLPGKGPYGTDDGSGSILGVEQWRWLEQVLAVPADLRIVASSIQVLAEHHGWESWSNFPSEQERLIGLLAASGSPTLFVSGDRHFSEVSRRVPVHPDVQFAMTEITASSINRRYPAAEPTANRYRVGDYFLDSNITELDISWPVLASPPLITARVFDAAGAIQFTHTVNWDPDQ